MLAVAKKPAILNKKSRDSFNKSREKQLRIAGKRVTKRLFWVSATDRVKKKGKKKFGGFTGML